MRRAKGTTLVELAIVAVVLAIAVALSSPSPAF
jgi:Tfp pilus assembly protein PilE